MNVLGHPADLASINPILPRLGPAEKPHHRTERAHWEIRAAPHGRVGKLCCECSKHLSDFRSWVECRVCRQPMCRECLGESFSQDDAGACSDCRNPTVRPPGHARVGPATGI